LRIADSSVTEILDHNGNTGPKVRRIRAACNEKEPPHQNSWVNFGDEPKKKECGMFTERFEPPEERFLNCEKTTEAKRLRAELENTPGKAPQFLNRHEKREEQELNEKAHRRK